MQARKLGPMLLCGLMVGPVLGSGIFILPPLVLEAAGSWALPAWGVTILLNCVFAFVFGMLSILFPGDAGVAEAINNAFGVRAKRLASYYLISAVIFGPAAVLLTIADYLPVAPIANSAEAKVLFAMALIPVGFWLLLRKIRSLGQVALALSSISAVLLFAGSCLMLVQHPDVASGSNALPPLASFDSASFGNALLMLFWIVVGWEVVGNYSAEVIAPEKTIPLAVGVSVAVITMVELAVACSLQLADTSVSTSHGVAKLLFPLVGDAAPVVGGMLVFALCATTYLMFVGGVARLMAAMAEEGALPFILAGRSATGAPLYAVLALCSAQLFSLILVWQGVLELESLVAIASGFFLANAFIGALSAFKLQKGWMRKSNAILLSAVLFVVMLQSSWWVLATIALVAVVTFRQVSRLVNVEG